ncbi:MAG: hypothetical protein FJX53_02230 [Alphaproteobacteria bacterium]|nr:hypothetical protein [Alphaproteobacteria bacterium]
MLADTAASDYINSLNALCDARIVVTFLQAVYPERTIFVSALRSVKTEMQMSDGSKKQVPVVDSSLLGQIQAHLAGAKLQGERIGQIGGNYQADTEGDCPFTSGPITLTQKSCRAEGTRGDELLLTGAVGDGTVVFLAYEPRFASAVETMAQARTLVVPDRPPVVYSAPLGAEQLVLTDNDHACKIALMRR